MNHKNFTPGPWKGGYSRDGKEYMINDGKVGNINTDDLGDEESQANVNLVLAAPDMFDALEFIVDNTFPMQTIYDVAIKALNKAKGNEDTGNNFDGGLAK